MWLLSTDRAELHEFLSPDAVPGGYAILSHVWDEEEETFEETRLVNERIRESANVTGKHIHSHVAT